MRAMISLLKAIVDLLIRLTGNSKRTSGNLLTPLRPQNKDLGAASQKYYSETSIKRTPTGPFPVSA